MIFITFSGIMVAAAVFAALLWSIFQGVTMRGRLQWAHIGSVFFTIAGMASISMLSPTFAMLCGIGLAISAGVATWMEFRWNRLLTFFQLVFAVVLILGLPFAFN